MIIEHFCIYGCELPRLYHPHHTVMFVVFHWDDFFKLKMCSAISNEVCNSGTHSVGGRPTYSVNNYLLLCWCVTMFTFFLVEKIIHFPPFYDPNHQKSHLLLILQSIVYGLLKPRRNFSKVLKLCKQLWKYNQSYKCCYHIWRYNKPREKNIFYFRNFSNQNELWIFCVLNPHG